MIAMHSPVESRLRNEDVLARVPQRAFGETEWVRLALQSTVQFLEPAIRSGQPYRIANAIRAIVHTPNAEQRDAVVNAACDALLTNAYTDRDSRMVSEIADARSLIDGILTELDENAERAAIEPPLLRATVDGLMRLAALADKRLADRLDATGHFAARIATVMQLSRKTVLDIELAGCLHDIGMVGMAGASRPKEEIHRRKDRGVKSHAIIGEGFLRDLPALAHLAPFVRAHHERYDGSGFPDGLRGNEIPLESRVISVAAIFIERVTGSPQRDAMQPQDVCQELLLRSGTHFDPDVVAATLQLLHFRQRTNRSA